MQNEYYPLEKFLEEHFSGFKLMRFHSDIMYKAVCYNKYSRAYKKYCNDRNLINNAETIQYEVKEYERRLNDARYEGKIG